MYTMWLDCNIMYKYANKLITTTTTISNTNMVVVLIVQYTVYMHVHASC